MAGAFSLSVPQPVMIQSLSLERGTSADGRHTASTAPLPSLGEVGGGLEVTLMLYRGNVWVKVIFFTRSEKKKTFQMNRNDYYLTMGI